MQLFVYQQYHGCKRKHIHVPNKLWQLIRSNLAASFVRLQISFREKIRPHLNWGQGFFCRNQCQTTGILYRVFYFFTTNEGIRRTGIIAEILHLNCDSLNGYIDLMATMFIIPRNTYRVKRSFPSFRKTTTHQPSSQKYSCKKTRPLGNSAILRVCDHFLGWWKRDP